MTLLARRFSILICRGLHPLQRRGNREGPLSHCRFARSRFPITEFPMNEFPNPDLPIPDSRFPIPDSRFPDTALGTVPETRGRGFALPRLCVRHQTAATVETPEPRNLGPQHRAGDRAGRQWFHDKKRGGYYAGSSDLRIFYWNGGYGAQ